MDDMVHISSGRANSTTRSGGSTFSDSEDSYPRSHQQMKPRYDREDIEHRRLQSLSAALASIKAATANRPKKRMT